MYNRNEKIWVFNAGDSFSGNPKWLFMYIQKERKDIKTYWLCYKKECLKYIRRLGYKAYLFDSSKGKNLMTQAGVYVVNQCKEIFQDELEGIKVLNLWHGVGCKAIERKGDFGYLNEKIAKKYIRNHQIYKNNQLFLVTSPLMEQHFSYHCELDEDKIIREGYPSCFTKMEVKTFDHNIIEHKKKNSDTKVAIYSPTYRDNGINDFFGRAIPDMERLIRCLEKNNILLIFKLHPQMEKDPQYNVLKSEYHNCNSLIFWNNLDDVYEVFDRIDLAIIDYSSIFYDLLAKGVKNFIRYMFDIEDKTRVRDFVFDIKEMTCGNLCSNFDELVETLENYQYGTMNLECNRIYNMFWKYATDNGNEKIIERTLDFEVEKKREYPTLYSFDIFDTIIKRTVLSPLGVFFYVKDKIYENDIEFPYYVFQKFVKSRREAEANVREYYNKTLGLRKDGRIEVTLDEIYARLKEVFNLTDEQTNELKRLEIEGEMLTCVPYEENLNKLKDLVANGEKVVLISDMYLPKQIVKDILVKADPILGRIPLYLSSEWGGRKINRQLYVSVYKDMEYHYKEWIHFGDNYKSDYIQAEMMGIKPVCHEICKFSPYEKNLADSIAAYDGYLVSALMARYREREKNSVNIYAHNYVSLYFVPYVSWVVRKAVEKGLKTLYFISRDGHHLCKIADTIIKERKLSLKVKYIYGSRKAWRVPSFINEVDPDFFSVHGNFSGAKKYEAILKALCMDEKTFEDYFPELAYLKEKEEISNSEIEELRLIFSQSEQYNEYLLSLARKTRPVVLEYLRQEIDFEEDFAFVEYWARGYTQDCLSRLLEEACGKSIDTPFFYVRSIYPTVGSSIRYNFTTSNKSLLFVEAIFANMPYRSVEKYQRNGSVVEPVIVDCDNDMQLHKAMESELIKFASEFSRLSFLDKEKIERHLFDFGIMYYHKKPFDKVIKDNLGHLKYTDSLYGKVREFAPPITMKLMIEKWIFKKSYPTRSFKMSMSRSFVLYRKINTFIKILKRK